MSKELLRQLRLNVAALPDDLLPEAEKVVAEEIADRDDWRKVPTDTPADGTGVFRLTKPGKVA